MPVKPFLKSVLTLLACLLLLSCGSSSLHRDAAGAGDTGEVFLAKHFKETQPLLIEAKWLFGEANQVFLINEAELVSPAFLELRINRIEELRIRAEIQGKQAEEKLLALQAFAVTAGFTESDLLEEREEAAEQTVAMRLRELLTTADAIRREAESIRRITEEELPELTKAYQSLTGKNLSHIGTRKIWSASKSIYTYSPLVYSHFSSGAAAARIKRTEKMVGSTGSIPDFGSIDASNKGDRPSGLTGSRGPPSKPEGADAKKSRGDLSPWGPKLTPLPDPGTPATAVPAASIQSTAALSFAAESQKIDGLVRGSAAVSAPSQAKAGKSFSVVLRVSPEKLQALLSGMKEDFPENTTLKGKAGIKLTPRMSAGVHGFGFEVSPKDGTIQAVSANEPTTWQWQVKPVESGLQTLTFTLASTATIEGKEVARNFYSYEQKVQVAVSPMGFLALK